MLTSEEIENGAALLAARTIRAIDPRIVEAEFPDGEDALRVYEALLAAHLRLDWPRPGVVGRAKAVAVVGSPLLVPILAIMWLTWRIEYAISRRRGRKDQPPRKRHRA